MRRRRRFGRLSLLYSVILVAILAGGSLWLDRRGELVVATVTGKTEEITLTHEPQGGWHRHYRVGAAFHAAGTPAAATVTVDRNRYDSLRPGDSLAIRYLPALPLFARTPDRSTATVVAEATQGFLGSELLGWVACGVVASVIAARLGMVPVVITGLLWMAAGYLLLLQAPRVPVPAGLDTTARVRAVTLVAKSPARRTSKRRSRASWSRSARQLALPYQVVELQVPVRGRPDSLLAVDAVDSGSVAGLSVGAVLPVRLPAGDPRDARLARGTRTFVERNRHHYRPIVVVLPLLGMLVGWGFRRRRADATSRPRVGDSAPGHFAAAQRSDP